MTALVINFVRQVSNPDNAMQAKNGHWRMNRSYRIHWGYEFRLTPCSIWPPILHGVPFAWDGPHGSMGVPLPMGQKRGGTRMLLEAWLELEEGKLLQGTLED